MSCLEPRGELRIPSHGIMIVALIPLTFFLTWFHLTLALKVLVENCSVLPPDLDMYQL